MFSRFHKSFTVKERKKSYELHLHSRRSIAPAVDSPRSKTNNQYMQKGKEQCGFVVVTKATHDCAYFVRRKLYLSTSNVWTLSYYFYSLTSITHFLSNFEWLTFIDRSKYRSYEMRLVHRKITLVRIHFVMMTNKTVIHTSILHYAVRVRVKVSSLFMR